MVLDLGCGTGYFSSALQAAFPAGHYFGMDLAEGMVTYAQQYQRGDWLCGDAEKIPLADNSIDIIFSSLAIQWCEDLDSVFAEIARVLKPGGQFIFSTLGPDTLHELREAWRQVDDYVHVNRFVEQQVLDRAAKDSSLQLADDYIQQQEITLQYDTLKQLTAELKALGAHNVNSGRPAGLTGKNRMQKFIQAYERQRNTASMLPASYQVWYGRLSKPLAEVDVMNIAGVKHGGA
jgi:malonyl-CoA O-methyltransferase